MILLVVDTQKGCFDERLYAFAKVRDNIKRLISLARENNVEVVYVQHDDGLGTDLDKSSDNYEVYEEFAPSEGEKRFALHWRRLDCAFDGADFKVRGVGRRDGAGRGREHCAVHAGVVNHTERPSVCRRIRESGNNH